MEVLCHSLNGLCPINYAKNNKFYDGNDRKAMVTALYQDTNPIIMVADIGKMRSLQYNCKVTTKSNTFHFKKQIPVITATVSAISILKGTNRMALHNISNSHSSMPVPYRAYE